MKLLAAIALGAAVFILLLMMVLRTPDVELSVGAVAPHHAGKSNGLTFAEVPEVERVALLTEESSQIQPETMHDIEPSAPVDTAIEASAAVLLETDTLSYADMSDAELGDAIKTINLELSKITSPIYDELIAAGRFEVVGIGKEEISSPDDDDHLLVGIQHEAATGQTRRVVIPENEYPEAYVLKHEMTKIHAELKYRNDERNRERYRAYLAQKQLEEGD